MIPGNNSMCMNIACHSNDQKPWFIDNSTFDAGIHAGANCTDCHTPLPVRIDGKIGAGETVCYNFTIPDDVKEMTVRARWELGSLDLILIAPNGSVVTATMNETYADCTIQNPMSGVWNACLMGAANMSSLVIDVSLLMEHPGTPPHECEVCHLTPPRYGAPQAVQHTRDATKVRVDPDCMGCHNKSEMILPHGYEVESAAANVSHYGKPRYDIIVDGGGASDCSYCHVGGGNEFSDVFADSSKKDITHGVDCMSCHGYGRIHDATLTSAGAGPITNGSTFMGNSTATQFTYHVPERRILLDVILAWNNSDSLYLYVTKDGAIYRPEHENHTSLESAVIYYPCAGDYVAHITGVTGDNTFNITFINVSESCTQCHNPDANNTNIRIDPVLHGPGDLCSDCHVDPHSKDIGSIEATVSDAVGYGTVLWDDEKTTHLYGDSVFTEVSESDFVSQGETISAHQRVNDKAKRLITNLTWGGSDLDITEVQYIDPKGDVYTGFNRTAAAANPSKFNITLFNATEGTFFNCTNCSWYTTSTKEFLIIDKPGEGNWTIVSNATDVIDTESYTYSSVVQKKATCVDCHVAQVGMPPIAIHRVLPTTEYLGKIEEAMKGYITESVFEDIPDVFVANAIDGLRASTANESLNRTIYAHAPGATIVKTTVDCSCCHNRDYGTRPHGGYTPDYYPSNLIDTEDCIACHEDENLGIKWGHAPEPRNITRYESIEDATDIETTIRTGEIWKLKNDYEIVVGPISSAGDTVRINLSHKGTVVASKVVRKGGVFEYETAKDWIRSKSNNDSDLYGTGSETYKHRRAEKSKYTTIVDLKVTDIMSSGMRGIVTFEGLVLKSRIHVESDNRECYTCHINEYRHAVEDGDDYVVLRTTGADGETDDSDDITIGKLAINFTENERKILYAQTEWDLGYGYMLRASEIDLDGRKARVELSRDGRVLESKVIHEGEMFMYNTTLTDPEGHTISDVTVFKMRITGVFR